MSSEIILPESPEAAVYREDIKGWVSRRGLFFGDGEAGEVRARLDGATHNSCQECTGTTERPHTLCKECSAKRQKKRYEAMPFREWDGKAVLVLFNDDKYFREQEEVEDYCDEFGIDPKDLMLVICEPVYCREIDPADYYHDIIPEDGELPRYVEDAFRKLNQTLTETKIPVSWTQGKFRTTLTAEEN